MTTPFLISGSVSLNTLSLLLDLTERRVQQLAHEGIVVRRKAGRYDLIPSIQGYIHYLRAQAQKKRLTVSEEQLARVLACFKSPRDWL